MHGSVFRILNARLHFLIFFPFVRLLVLPSQFLFILLRVLPKTKAEESETSGVTCWTSQADDIEISLPLHESENGEDCDGRNLHILFFRWAFCVKARAWCLTWLTFLTFSRWLRCFSRITIVSRCKWEECSFILNTALPPWPSLMSLTFLFFFFPFPENAVRALFGCAIETYRTAGLLSV